MKQRLAIIAFGLAAAIMPASAEACRIRPTPPPVIPEPYDALVIAAAPADIVPPPGASGDRWPAFRVVEVLDGRVAPTQILILQSLGPAPNEQGEVVITVGCAPPPPDTIPVGYAMRPGERVLAVVRRDQGFDRVTSWTPLEDAMRAEPFIARFLAARDPAERRRLAAHWREARRRPGPVPLTDPAGWFAPASGGLAPARADYVTAVEFDVRDDGGIANCELVWSSAPAPRDRTICPTLAARNRFEPPLRFSERRGLYEVRWNAGP